jgi:hypothetical protein
MDRFVTDQLYARLFDQRNKTVLQAVHLLGSELDGKIGKTLQVPDATADAVACFQNRDLAPGSSQALRRGQSGSSCPDDDDRLVWHLGPKVGLLLTKDMLDTIGNPISGSQCKVATKKAPEGAIL